MSGSSVPSRLAHFSLPLAAVIALAAGACERTPPTQPGVAQVPDVLAGGGPNKTADITVSLTHPLGGVVGTWNLTYINADNGMQFGGPSQTSVTVTCNGGPCQALVQVPAGSDGCFLARPIFPTSSFPLDVPPPDENDLNAVAMPAADGQPLAGVMTASDGSGGFLSSPITGAEFARSCVRDGAVSYNNGGQGPNPVVLTPPDGLRVDLTVINPGGQTLLGGGNAEASPDGYGLIPLCESGLPAAWTQTASNEGRQGFQGLAIGLTGNPGNTVPLYVALNQWQPFPCSPELPFFVFESDIVGDPSTGTEITATRKYFFPDDVIQTEPIEGEYLLCKQEVSFEALSDGDPAKVDFRGVNTEAFTQGRTDFAPFTAIKFGFQGAFGENQMILPLTTPGEVAVAIRYEHVGAGDATLSVRARNTASGTMSGQFPYTCGSGTCTAGSGSGALASVVTATLSSMTRYPSVDGRTRYAITWSLSQLPSAEIEWSLSTARDEHPNASKTSKKNQISSAFVQITAPLAAECEVATNDDRWYAR